MKAPVPTEACARKAPRVKKSSAVSPPDEEQPQRLPGPKPLTRLERDFMQKLKELHALAWRCADRGPMSNVSRAAAFVGREAWAAIDCIAVAEQTGGTVVVEIGASPHIEVQPPGATVTDLAEYRARRAGGGAP